MGKNGERERAHYYSQHGNNMGLRLVLHDTWPRVLEVHRKVPEKRSKKSSNLGPPRRDGDWYGASHSTCQAATCN